MIEQLALMIVGIVSIAEAVMIRNEKDLEWPVRWAMQVTLMAFGALFLGLSLVTR